jgi:phage major head subunit gpT-like protein
MTAIRANFGPLLAPGLRSVFFDQYDSYPTEYTEIFNVHTSTRKYEDDYSVSGFGLVPQKDESVGIIYDDPVPGYSKRYTHTTFGLGFRVSRELYEDDMYGIIRRMPKALGKSMRLTVEIDAANVLNNGFTASTYAGPDGVALFSASHPLTGGGVSSNTLAVAADLSETSLEQAMIDIMATTDDRGLLQMIRPKKLVVGPALAWTASRLLESTLTPGSANNAINPAKGIMPFVVNHYLTDPDAWFILADDTQLNWFWRRKPDFDNDNDFDTEDAKFKATARWSNGFSDWRGVYASPGA